MTSKSSTTTEQPERLPNPHPGEILAEDFLKPMGLSQSRLAREIGVPPRRINEIVLAKRAVTADTDLRLARYFGMSEGIWLGLQAAFDLEKRRLELGDRLEREVRHHAA
jgi:addiction module HigA family antidote